MSERLPFSFAVTSMILLGNNITTPGNRLYAMDKGRNVTIPICWTCKNCSYKCAVDCVDCHTISTEQF